MPPQRNSVLESDSEKKRHKQSTDNRQSRPRAPLMHWNTEYGRCCDLKNHPTVVYVILKR